METQETCYQLKNQIESKRNLMISTGLINGISNMDTVQLSQELDKLIIRFQRNCNCWNKFLLLD